MIPLTFNLLPPERRREFDDLILYAAVKRTVVGIAIFLAIFTGVLFLSLSMLKHSVSGQKGTTATIRAQISRQNGASFDQQIRDFNTLLAKVNVLQTGYRKWTPILRELLSIIPNGVTLSGLDLDGAQHVATIRGSALQRSDLLALQNALSTSKQFSDPSSPISNLLQKENILFEIRVTITQK